MTNKEAISRIKFLLDVGGADGFTYRDEEALNAAIYALSERKTPQTNGDKIRQMTDEELAWINGEGWTFSDTGNGHTENWSFDDVKYWMHLPEPPKREQK